MTTQSEYGDTRLLRTRLTVQTWQTTEVALDVKMEILLKLLNVAAPYSQGECSKFCVRELESNFIASDKALFQLKSTDVFSYFSSKTYVVGTH